MIGVNLPEGIHHIRFAVLTKDLFLSPSDGEFALALDVLGVCEIKGTKACLCEVHSLGGHSSPCKSRSPPSCYRIASLWMKGAGMTVSIQRQSCWWSQALV